MTGGLELWAAVAAADLVPVADREALAARFRLAGLGMDGAAAVIETCHRVEAYGIGEVPRSLAGDATLARLLRGDDAARHLARLAAGLESAVVGEDQILHQVRTALATVCDRGGDPRLIRLFELAVGAGRRARAGRTLTQRDLGELAVTWLAARRAVVAGSSAIVVGAGVMGRLVVGALAGRGVRILVASRSADRAARVARTAGAATASLAVAATAAPAADAVVVAIRGAWDFDAGAEIRPWVVDLSVPPALPRKRATSLGERYADIDRIHRDAPGLVVADRDAVAGYVRAAEAIVEETVAAYRTWSDGRASVATLRALRERSEADRAAELRRLLGRLPDLDARERHLLEAFSERLVARLLHAPSAALRDDSDGSAAVAAERLFRL